ncbi:MAG: hydrogenase expression/formation protein HupK [Roseobacter sp.]|jgi:hypothetical protein
MLDAARISLKAQKAQALPIAAMVLGKPRNDVADLLPRLFNLCRAAQSMAVRLALDLENTDTVDAVRREIIRDHVLRLTVVLPGHFGRSPMTLPQGWQNGGDALRKAVFGGTGRLPENLEAFEAYMRSGEGLSGLWKQVSGLFADGEAETRPLPFVSSATAADATAQVENSCAARVGTHPVVAGLGKERRSLLWRVVARSYDLQALLDNAPLTASNPEPGFAHVAATRGLYTVCAQHDGTRVTAFSRVTPTDHLQAAGGVLDQTLAGLPVTRAGLVPLVMDILDPCAPIRVKEAADA